MYYLPYQIKAFGLVWADNYELISAPLILERVSPLLLFHLSVCYIFLSSLPFLSLLVRVGHTLFCQIFL